MHIILLKIKSSNIFLIKYFICRYTFSHRSFSSTLDPSMGTVRKTLTQIIRKRDAPSINAAYRRDVYFILLKICASKERKTRTTIEFHISNSMQFFFDRRAKDAFNKSVVTNANVFRCVFHLKSLPSRRESEDKWEKEYVNLNIIFFQVQIFFFNFRANRVTGVVNFQKFYFPVFFFFRVLTYYL